MAAVALSQEAFRRILRPAAEESGGQAMSIMQTKLAAGIEKEAAKAAAS